MFKILKPVGMLLLVSTVPVGVLHAENLGFNTSILQQDAVCQGVVKDVNGEPVIGASVVVKGTTNGVITDLDGKFVLSHVTKGAVLEISFVGYVSQQVKWNGQALDLVIKEDTQTLDEVVVVGFGS